MAARRNVMESYTYETTANWIGARKGIVHNSSISPPVAFSAPPEFQGEAGIWTPEHLLVAAVASCFITTFRAIAETSKFDAPALEVTVEGFVEKSELAYLRLGEIPPLTQGIDGVANKQSRGYSFTRVFVRPRLTVAKAADRERGLRLLEKAERSCLVSRSLRSEIILEPEVVVSGRLAVAA
jgi:organic hydroperoxide reductase OsmC/OhrA